MTTLLATYIHHVRSMLKQLDYLHGDQILPNSICTVQECVMKWQSTL